MVESIDATCPVNDSEAAGESAQHALDVFGLPRRLLGDTRWFVVEHPSASARTLQDVAALVVRLQSLERGFAAELLRQKTEALYHFAYGLSHELNNPLANIATRAGVLGRDESHPARQDLLATIVDNAMRGSEMLGDLMLIARPPKLSPTAISAKLFAEPLAQKAASWSRGRDVNLASHIDSTSHLHIDVSAMQEAVWCLIRNAIESMPDGGEVTLTVRDTQPERYVQMEIADRGTGLSPHAQEHCFDPYFSGREAGRGLGMGLAKAQRIVELHTGKLSLYNRPGGGCQAVIELPILS
jgi:signal transduction histidine kinase